MAQLTEADKENPDEVMEVLKDSFGVESQLMRAGTMVMKKALANFAQLY